MPYLLWKLWLINDYFSYNLSFKSVKTERIIGCGEFTVNYKFKVENFVTELGIHRYSETVYSVKNISSMWIL